MTMTFFLKLRKFCQACEIFEIQILEILWNIWNQHKNSTLLIIFIGIKILFFTVSFTIEPGRSLLTVRCHELFDLCWAWNYLFQNF